MTEIISVSPFRCRMWNGHERLEGSINEDTCREEIESVAKHGQRLPVLARFIKTDPAHDIELVYGARRLFVARHLNVPLLVEIRTLTDREAIVALDIENRMRKELSPYERGRSFQNWLRAGLFVSQDELARELNISASQVSRLLKLAQLPSVLVNAFPSPMEICENWGRDLIELWSTNECRDKVARAARTIAKETPRPAASAVFERLLATDTEEWRRRTARPPSHDEVVKDKDGKPLFRICVRRRCIALMLPAEDLSSAAIADIKLGITSILQRARLQLPNSKGIQRQSRSAVPASREAMTEDRMGSNRP